MNLDEGSEMITFGSLLTTFKMSKQGSSENWLEPKIKPSNQIKLVYIPDTHCSEESIIDHSFKVHKSKGRVLLIVYVWPSKIKLDRYRI